MEKMKIHKYKKIKFLIFICIILSIFISVIRYCQYSIEPQLKALSVQQTGYAIHYIVKEAIGQMESDTSNFINVKYNAEGEVTDITYDTKQMNDYLYRVLDIIDTSLQCTEKGIKSPYSSQDKFQDGVLYEVKLGYFLHSYVLSNLGPSFKIRLKMCNDAIGNIITETLPYGVDSTLVKISLDIHVDAKAITYISSYDVSKEIKIPLVIQIVKGGISSMYPYSKY